MSSDTLQRQMKAGPQWLASLRWVAIAGLFAMLPIALAQAQTKAARSIIKEQMEANDSIVKEQVEVADSIIQKQAQATDSIIQAIDSMYMKMSLDTLAAGALTPEMQQKAIGKNKRDWSKWHPDPQRALWLALVIPGGGQIYNRKYWKLPIVYGGFIGCIYALNWNNMMYKDYAQAYLDLMDDDPGTASYNKFLHLGRQITPENSERYKTIFKNRKDKYRRWRDLSFFVMIGIYAISVIDAYVDAELSEFDISKDLSMKVRPTLMGSNASRNPLYATAVGVNCSINF